MYIRKVKYNILNNAQQIKRASQALREKCPNTEFFLV